MLSGRGSSDPRSGKAGTVQDQTTRFPGRARSRLEAGTPADRLRLVAGEFSTAHVAQATGVSNATAHRYLHGRPASLQFLAAFSRTFDAPLDWLLLGRGPRRSGEAARWALATAELPELFAALGERVRAGDPVAVRAAARLASPGSPPPQVTVPRRIDTGLAASTAARTP